MKKIQSTCNLCALACNLDFYVENGKIEKVILSSTLSPFLKNSL